MSDAPLLASVRKALAIAWFMVALAGGFVAAAPFALRAETLQTLFPACESRLRGTPCAACGLTTAFIAISKHRLEDARQANAGAVPLFVLLVANLIGGLAYGIRRLARGGKLCNW